LVGREYDRKIPAVPASKVAAATAEIIRIFMRNVHPVEADANFAIVSLIRSATPACELLHTS
jgi:hypothetical protein